MKSIYVGNLSLRTTEDSLRCLFEVLGAVQLAEIITDRETGCSKGFGFVEMSHDPQAEAAIRMLNGADLDGRVIVVEQARPRAERAFSVGQRRAAGIKTNCAG